VDVALVSQIVRHFALSLSVRSRFEAWRAHWKALLARGFLLLRVLAVHPLCTRLIRNVLGSVLRLEVGRLNAGNRVELPLHLRLFPKQSWPPESHDPSARISGRPEARFPRRSGPTGGTALARLIPTSCRGSAEQTLSRVLLRCAA
jgi:hypothetical protein